jgi:hypothetical protein
MLYINFINRKIFLNFIEAISSVLPLDAQLPMCLRGSTDEQLNLASLFNTLIHHKKCRRTRTVFTGNIFLKIKIMFKKNEIIISFLKICN